MGNTRNKKVGDELGSFAFTEDNMRQANIEMAKYPEKRQASAIMALLYIAQEQCGGWIPLVAQDYIAKLLNLPNMRVYEVANFYTMYNKKQVGKHLIQVCRTTPCALRGAEAITDACKQKLEIELGETTVDGKFTLVEVECLGACVNAPVAQINYDYYEDLTEDIIREVIDDLSNK